jgi:putative transposase
MKGLMPDHVHMMISIPPKYAVSQVIGCVKGKSASGSVAKGMKKISYSGYRFPPEIIQQAIWLLISTEN